MHSKTSGVKRRDSQPVLSFGPKAAKRGEGSGPGAVIVIDSDYEAPQHITSQPQPPPASGPDRAVNAFDVLKAGQREASASETFALRVDEAGDSATVYWDWRRDGSATFDGGGAIVGAQPSALSSAVPWIAQCSVRLGTHKLAPTFTVRLSGVGVTDAAAPSNVGPPAAGARPPSAPGLAPDPTCTLSPSVLLSSLQKAVRRGNVDGARRVAAELWRRSPTDAARRVAVIVVEDSLLHPSYPLLVWLVMALSKGLAPGRSLAAAFISIVEQTAACAWADTQRPSAVPRPPSLPGGTGRPVAPASAALPTSASGSAGSDARPALPAGWAWVSADDAGAVSGLAAELDVEDRRRHTVNAAQPTTVGRRVATAAAAVAAMDVDAGLPAAAAVASTSWASAAADDERARAACAALVRALVVRACFGGQAGDVAMLRGAALAWRARFSLGPRVDGSRAAAGSDAAAVLATDVASSSLHAAAAPAAAALPSGFDVDAVRAAVAPLFALSPHFVAVVGAAAAAPPPPPPPPTAAAAAVRGPPSSPAPAGPAWLRALYDAHGLPATPGAHRVGSVSRCAVAGVPRLTRSTLPLEGVDFICSDVLRGVEARRPAAVAAFVAAADDARRERLVAAAAAAAAAAGTTGPAAAAPPLPAPPPPVDAAAAFQQAMWSCRSGVNRREDVGGGGPAAVPDAADVAAWSHVAPAVDEWCRAFVAARLPASMG